MTKLLLWLKTTFFCNCHRGLFLIFCQIFFNGKKSIIVGAVECSKKTLAFSVSPLLDSWWKTSKKTPWH